MNRAISALRNMPDLKAEFDMLYAESSKRRRMMSVSAHDRIAGAHHAPRSSKSLSFMRSTVPVSFSCEKTRLRVSRSAVRKQFAKVSSGEERPLKRIALKMGEPIFAAAFDRRADPSRTLDRRGAS